MERVRIFSDMIAYLRIAPDGMLAEMAERFGADPKKNADLADMKVSTLYLMQDIDGGCQANCAFCVQSRGSSRPGKQAMLVDNTLVRYPLKMLLSHFEKGLLERRKFVRICLQTLYSPGTVPNLLALLRSLRSATDIPITACCIPVDRAALADMKSAGLDIVSINYETATPELFRRIRGEERSAPFRWDAVTRAVEDSLEIFGKGKVGSHLQLGLGETAQEAIAHIQRLRDRGVFVSLFAFQPVARTALEQLPRISHQDFHAVQLASYLVQTGARRAEEMTFDGTGRIRSYGLTPEKLSEYLASGAPFRNRGCPGCNRIYYETRPNERFFTYPRPPSTDELGTIRREVLQYLAS